MDTAPFCFPLGYKVRWCRQVAPLSPTHVLWVANVKAYYEGNLLREFKGVYFVESEQMACIAGIERADGYPPYLKSAAARKQQALIQFLRDQTRQENDRSGMFACAFSGHEYANELQLTTGYLDQRGLQLMGIGYHTHEGGYELIGVETDAIN